MCWAEKKQQGVACLSEKVSLITLMRQCPSTGLWREREGEKKQSLTQREKNSFPMYTL